MPENTSDKNFFVRRRNFRGSELRKNITTNWDIENVVSSLCDCIQIIDQKKIRDFFIELEDTFFSSGKSAEEIRQECMILMIEVRCNLKNKFPAIKDSLPVARVILNDIMRLFSLEEITDAMISASLYISGCLSLISAENSFLRIISYVKNNYSEDLKLENLGKLFGYNSAYLGKRFRKYTGKSFNSYLDTLRLDAAKELLRTRNMKVYEISTAVGYNNADYFYTKFKKYTGQSPLFFRDN